MIEIGTWTKDNQKENIKTAIETYPGLLEATNSYEILWDGAKQTSTGGWFMNETHTIALPKPISSLHKGIILHWQAYESSTAKNYDHHYNFIPKSHINKYDGAETNIILGTANKFGRKCLLIGNNSIVGTSSNDTNNVKNGVSFTNNFWVLTQVIGI